MAGRRWSRSAKQVSDDRAWSAHTSVHPRSSTTDLVAHTALPAETGPTFAPDRLSIWPVEGGRFGIDAHYHGHTGEQRAEIQVQRLARAGLPASVRKDDAGALIRLGPLAHAAAWLAIEAFIGKPLPVTPPAATEIS
jgi:hypothetical protein